MKTATSLANISTASISPPNSEPSTPVVARNKPVVEPKPAGKPSNYYQTITPLPFKTPSLEHTSTLNNKDEHFDDNANVDVDKDDIKIEKFNFETHPLYCRKKLSLYVPPPPKLPIYKNESSESWNCFLAQLGKIIDNRVGELV